MGATYKVHICNKEVEISKTRGRAIKAYCTDCSAGQPEEVKECPATTCPLYIFRGYIRWNTEKKVLSEDERSEVRERLNSSRLKRVADKQE